jgi:hypothetical protein
MNANLLNQVTSPADETLIVPISLSDFLSREFPAREYLLKPWLPTQGLIIVYAVRGVGKTFLALSAAYAVASGGSFLEFTAPSPAGVLYIDGEMPATTMQERLASITASSRHEASTFTLLTPDLQPRGMPRLDTRDGQDAIDQVLDDDHKLIVVDNISSLTRAKENEADGWTPVQEWALRMRASGRSVMFIHHAGKGGAQRGTGRREDVLDTVIALRRPNDYDPRQGAVFEVHFEKARGIHGDDVNPLEANLMMGEDGSMEWGNRLLEESTFDKIVSLDKEGLNQKDIAEELGVNKSTVSRHLKSARARGIR